MVAIVEVPPPTSADDPNAWAAMADTTLWSAETFDQLGYEDLNDPIETAASLAVPSSNRRTLRWVALDDADDHTTVVGSCTCSLTLRDNLGTAGVHAVVRPDRRRQGIGTALFDAAEQRARRGPTPCSRGCAGGANTGGRPGRARPARGQRFRGRQPRQGVRQIVGQVQAHSLQPSLPAAVGSADGAAAASEHIG